MQDVDLIPDYSPGLTFNGLKQMRAEWVNGNVDSASGAWSSGEWSAAKQTSGNQNQFDAMMAGMPQGAWYAGLASLAVPQGGIPWQVLVRQVVQRVVL